MSKEQYVSFGNSKLLREKGFDEELRTYYNEEGDELELHDDFCDISNSECDSNYITYLDFYCVRPTQQMACRWLREEHKIDISVTPDDGSWWIKITELESWSCVFDGKVLNSDDIKYAYEGDTSTKEGCYEAGLEYVLKNLI